MTFTVTILGANSANFAYGRHQTAQVVNHNESLFLVDCGEATQIQMLRYRVKMNRINHIFISHLHGDHYLGLVGLMMTLQLQGRTQPLNVYGPRGLDEIIALQLRFSDTRLNYPAQFHVLDAGPSRLIFETEHLEVHTIPLEHRVPCNGFLFKEKLGKRRIIGPEAERLGLHPGQIAALRRGQDILDGDGRVTVRHQDVTLPPRQPRTYAYCSDTIYKPDLEELVKGATLLYHESTFLHERLERAQATFHTTARQAGRFAADADAGTLLLGHYSSRYRTLDALLDEARSEFANAHLAQEGCTYTLPFAEDGEPAAVSIILEEEGGF